MGVTSGVIHASLMPFVNRISYIRVKRYHQQNWFKWCRYVSNPISRFFFAIGKRSFVCFVTLWLQLHWVELIMWVVGATDLEQCQSKLNISKGSGVLQTNSGGSWCDELLGKLYTNEIQLSRVCKQIFGLGQVAWFYPYHVEISQQGYARHVFSKPAGR